MRSAPNGPHAAAQEGRRRACFRRARWALSERRGDALIREMHGGLDDVLRRRCCVHEMDYYFRATSRLQMGDGGEDLSATGAGKLYKDASDKI